MSIVRRPAGHRRHGGEDLLRRMGEVGQFDGEVRKRVGDSVGHGPEGADRPCLADALRAERCGRGWCFAVADYLSLRVRMPFA